MNNANLMLQSHQFRYLDYTHRYMTFFFKDPARPKCGGNYQSIQTVDLDQPIDNWLTTKVYTLEFS